MLNAVRRDIVDTKHAHAICDMIYDIYTVVENKATQYRAA